MFELTTFSRPERELMRMFDVFDRDMLGRSKRGGPFEGLESFSADLIDCGDSYKLEAELPGFNKEDINVSVDGDLLTVIARHNEEKKEDRKGYVYRERRCGSFSRSFDISGIDQASIGAEYKDGVLTLELPKAQKPQETTRKIELR